MELKQMISVWTWSGILLAIYGVIEGGMGIYYLIRPEMKTALWFYNPCLWWGGVMTLAGALLIWGGRNRK